MPKSCLRMHSRCSEDATSAAPEDENTAHTANGSREHRTEYPFRRKLSPDTRAIGRKLCQLGRAGTGHRQRAALLANQF